MSPKVSVIIPVYNTEEYLTECLQSILNQTFGDIEVIAINDGSTDGSLTILESFADIDNRVSVFSQTNMGQSVARNVGIEKARGEFIYFMDSDDVLSKTALEKCFERIINQQLDFVFFNASILESDGENRLAFDYKRAYIDNSQVYNGVEILSYLITNNCYQCSPCLHFISTKLIKQNNLRFHPGIIHEDELFFALLYFHAKRVGYINEHLFKRRVRAGSVMTSSFSMRNVNGYLVVLSQVRAFRKGRGMEVQKVSNELINHIVNPVCYNASSLPTLDRLTVLFHYVKYNYVRFLKAKNVLVLLFPGLIKLKGYFKR